MEDVGRTDIGAVSSAQTRRAVLARLGSGDTLDDAQLERMTRIAAQLSGASEAVSVISDGERHIASAYVLLDDDDGSDRDEVLQAGGELEASAIAAAAVALATHVPLIVNDARQDPRLGGAVTAGSCAAMPLYAGGVEVGTLMVLDPEPRTWTAQALARVVESADVISTDLERRLKLVAAQIEQRDQGAALSELRRSSERFRSVLAAMVDGVVLQDRTGVIHECNGAAERILGLTADQMMGRTSMDPRWRAIHEDGSDFPGHDHPSMRTLRTGEPLRDVVMGVHKPTGELTWLSICTQPLMGIDGEVESVVVTFTDITVRRAAEQQLECELKQQRGLRSLATLVAANAAPEQVFAAAAEQAAHVLSATSGGVIRLDWATGEAMLAGVWVASGEATAQPGTTVELGDETASARAARNDRAAASDHGPVFLGEAEEGTAISAPIHADGRIWGMLSVGYDEPVEPELLACRLERLERFAEVVGLGINSAEARDMLARQAATDFLTGLSNHRAFDERLEEEVQRATRHRRQLSLMLLDLDHFKRVNDEHGHTVGNQVLSEFATLLREESRGSELVGRVGGEEFAWILPEATHAEALAAAARLRKRIAAERFGDPKLRMTVSAGVCGLADAVDAEELFLRADEALYEAKQSGRDRVCRYRPGSLELPAD